MIHHTNKRFLKFLRHINTQHGGWISEDRNSFIWVFRPEECSSIDLILKELLSNVDDNYFYDNKLLMFRFRKRYKNFQPSYKKIDK